MGATLARDVWLVITRVLDDLRRFTKADGSLATSLLASARAAASPPGATFFDHAGARMAAPGYLIFPPPR